MNLKLPTLHDLYTEKEEYVPSFNKNRQLILSDLLNKFQNLAGKQLDTLGLGDDFRYKNNFYYVLVRMKGYFLSKLENQKYTLVTFPLQATTLQLYRYAYLLDENGNVVFYLISLWVLLDSTTRKMKVTKSFSTELKCKLPLIDTVVGLTDEKLYAIEYDEQNFKQDSSYIVSESDIDRNGHMNNTKYIRISEELLCNENFSTFEINFEKECFLSEKISLYKFIENKTQYILGKKEDNTTSFIVYFNFDSK